MATVYGTDEGFMRDMCQHTYTHLGPKSCVRYYKGEEKNKHQL